MSKQQKLVLIVAILASFVTFLDGTVVGVALPAIRHELGGGLALQQWINDAYLITLGTLILTAGSLSDTFGRKKILTFGLYGFLVTSLICAFAPTGLMLVIARGLQGIAGALLVPSSLAMIIEHFRDKAQAKAIGSWTAWTGIAYIIGPLVGGTLVQYASWRFVFGINILPIAAALIMLGMLQEETDVLRKKAIDFPGLLLGAVGLGGIVYALIEQGSYRVLSPAIAAAFIGGVILLIGFVIREYLAKSPMLPLTIFKVRNFSVGNVATLFIYAALSLQGFLLVIFLQQTAHYSAVYAGLASLPITILMFFLSARFGALAGKFGPRFFMAVGPILAGCGELLLLRTTISANYISQLLPGIILFGLGLAITVSPLTAAILGSVRADQAGIGSAVNNAVARIAGLLSVGVIGIIIGNNVSLKGFHEGIIFCAVLLIFGGLISAAGITNHARPSSANTNSK